MGDSANTKSAPMLCWAVTMPFRKEGTPVVGTMGRTLQRVVIMPVDDFKRLAGMVPDQLFTIGDMDG